MKVENPKHAKLIQEINRFDAEAKTLIGQGVLCMYEAGKRLQFFFDHKSNDLTWSEWLSINCPQISLRLATKYRELVMAAEQLPNGRLMLTDGVAACHILREWGQMKALNGNGDSRNFTAERKLRQLTLNFNFESCVDQLSSFVAVKKIDLSPSSISRLKTQALQVVQRCEELEQEHAQKIKVKTEAL